ncbi:MAG TPA: hypothetical protein K8V14_05750 [Staphylococcus ureilyticus]|uniref:hypothetical protein n=1 Tax=Staphylococcus ureilyticus TaxID=94138 RepID=UPI001D65561D|nr:hypothetical protein [Staphylococcus ureilyticus]HJG66803.1 hypothetical protein [Staphylococcus ureilyticus]
MKKYDLFNESNQSQKKPTHLRHMMSENDNDESKIPIKTRYKLFILVLVLLLIAFGIIGLFIL